MILDRLILKNFKRFRETEVDFQDGITGILGNNGTGKSSLVSAVLFALYGVQATGIAGDYIVSSFANPKEKCEVRLDFRIGGDTHTVVRTFKKGKTVSHDATFHRNGQLMATGVSPVEEAVKRTIGMGPTDFRNTIYAAQKDLLTLLDNTPAKRKEWFLRALGIEYLSTESQKVLKEEIDAKTGELRRKEGELAALEGRLGEDELAKLEIAAETAKAAIATHHERRNLTIAQKGALEARLRRLAEQQNAYTRLTGQQQALLAEQERDEARRLQLERLLKALAEDEAEYRRIEKPALSYPELRARLDRFQQQKAEHVKLTGDLGYTKREMGDLTTRAERQRVQLKALDAETEKRAGLVQEIRSRLNAATGIPEDRLDAAVSFRLAEINKRAGTLAAQLAHYQEERAKIAADQQTIRDAGPDGVCPLCRQKLGEHFGDIDREFETRLQDMADKAVADLAKQEKLGAERSVIEGIRPLLESLRTLDAGLLQRPAIADELARLEAQLADRAEVRQRIEAAVTTLAFREEEFAACAKETETARQLQARYSELGKKIGEAASVREQVAGIMKAVAEREAGLARIAESIATLQYDSGAIAKGEAAVQEAGVALRDVEVALAGAEKDLRFTEEKIAEFHKTGDAVRALREEAGRISEEIELTKATRSLIADYVVYLMQVVRSRLEGETSRIIGEITGGRYEQVLLDEDFNLLVRDVDNDYPVDRFSGGEQDDIAVALRIALSRYLAELHNVHESTFLIFDEIFGSQDEERRNNLLVALRTQESRFPQILLISHIAEIQGEFANTLVVEMGTDGTSRIREAA